MFNTASISYSPSSGFSAGWSVGMSPYSGFPISSNIASAGVNYNFASKSWSGNASVISISRNGMEFNPSFSAMIYPQHTTNFLRGQGFRSNDKVLDRFVAYGQHQRALDYFGFKGTYDPRHPKMNGDHAIAVGNEIFYNTSSFTNGYDFLHWVADHELRHSRNMDRRNYKNRTMDDHLRNFEEYDTYMYNYKRQGLYLNTSQHIRMMVWHYGIKLGITPDELYHYFGEMENYPTPEWHFIYKIPRLW